MAQTTPNSFLKSAADGLKFSKGFVRQRSVSHFLRHQMRCKSVKTKAKQKCLKPLTPIFGVT